MSLIGSVAFTLTDLLRGSKVRGLLKAALEEERVTAEEADRRQLARARELVRYAMRHVPWYRERYTAAGVVADDIRSWADWKQLPVLRKDDIRSAGDALVSEVVAREDLIRHHSGGSTGVPLSFYHDRASVALSDVGAYRGFLRCGWRPGEMIGFFWGTTDRIRRMSTLEFEARQYLRRWYLFDAFDGGPETYERWVKALRRVRPTILYGYASAMADFAAYLDVRGVLPPPMKGIFSTAEKLYEPQRELIERVFRTKVYDCYGSSEVRNIATECELGSMHINADYAVVEASPLSDGGEGTGGATPLLVTSLINRAMPFIRYLNGDCGSPTTGSCSCGRAFPLMSLDVSRTNDFIVLADGSRIHSLAFIYLFYGSRGVHTFQFHQTTARDLILRVVPVPGEEAQFEAALANARQGVAALTKGMLSFQVERTQSIPRTSAGKHRYVMSDVASHPAPLLT